MSITSAENIIGGPALVTFDGATIYVDKDIKVKLTKETKNRSVAAFGQIGEVFMDVKAEISFAPAMWANLAILCPYLATLPGTRVFGNVDKPLVIQSITEGVKWTWSRCAITSPCKFSAGAKKDLIGEMTITAIKANATDWSGANSIVTFATSAYSDSSFDPTKLFDIPYLVTLDELALDTVDGVEVSPKLSLKPVETDQAGMIDMKFEDLVFEASFKPAALAYEDLLELFNIQTGAEGAPLTRGQQMVAAAVAMIIQGAKAGDPSITLPSMSVKDSGLLFDATSHAADALTLISNRTFSAGVPQPLAVLGSVAAEEPEA